MKPLVVIVKIAERCNLDCPYCYMYYGLDQSWRTRPAFLSDEHQRVLGDRFVQHLSEVPDAELVLELHGGEPLLLGKNRMRALLADMRARLPVKKLDICLQTNGVLLDAEWLDMFEEHGVGWALSCDGPPPVHNAFRVFHDGKPSSDAVEAALALSVERATRTRLFGGVLCVANPEADGAAVVRYFHERGVRQLDLLLPDANYVLPPKHLRRYDPKAMLSYMTRAFDQWIGYGDPRFSVRIFKEIMSGVFGARSTLDAFGGDFGNIFVVESDGSYQNHDVMHICGEGAAQTGHHVERHSIREFLARESAAFPPPCGQCQACPAFTACGGGYLPHRFDGESYDNPSFYCEVLFGLFAHIHNHVRSVTPASCWKKQEAAA